MLGGSVHLILGGRVHRILGGSVHLMGVGGRDHGVGGGVIRHVGGRDQEGGRDHGGNGLQIGQPQGVVGCTCWPFGQLISGQSISHGLQIGH